MFMPVFDANRFELSYNIEDIERILFRIEKIVILPKYEQWLRRETFVRTAYSSTMVENAAITSDEMEQAVKQAPLTNITEKRLDVLNYAKALEFVDFVSDTPDIVIDEGVIRQLHWLLMKEIHDTQVMPGQYRTGPNWIEDKGIKVYDPPFHVHVPSMMKDFADWLKSDQPIKPIIKAGIAHGHLVAIHPFVDGNGRTARLLAILLLRRFGYGFRKLLSLDPFYQFNRDGYISALRKSLGKQYTENYNLTEWLVYFTSSVLLQADRLEQQLTDWRIVIDKAHRDWKPLGLTDRQIDGMMYALRVGHVTRKDYIEITGVSPLTATRDLADLATKGFLEPKGLGRNRIYRMIPPQDTTSKEKTV